MMHINLADLRAALCKRRDIRGVCHGVLHFMHKHHHWAHDNLHTVYFGLGALKFWHMEGLIAASLCGVSATLFLLSISAVFEVES